MLQGAELAATQRSRLFHNAGAADSLHLLLHVVSHNEWYCCCCPGCHMTSGTAVAVALLPPCLAPAPAAACAAWPVESLCWTPQPAGPVCLQQSMLLCWTTCRERKTGWQQQQQQRQRRQPPEHRTRAVSAAAAANPLCCSSSRGGMLVVAAGRLQKQAALPAAGAHQASCNSLRVT